MTIIAGFRCEDGIVLCADSQETIGSAKRSVPKLRFEPCEHVEGEEDNYSNLAAAFCGAGDGPFIDKLVEEAWRSCRGAADLDSACAAIEERIKGAYKEFGEIYQRGQCPEVQLIYGVKMDGASRLFSAIGPIVNEKYEFDSGGIGHYMADFLAEKLHANWLPVRSAAILAAYILFEAKEHVEGCGGDSQIVALRKNDTSGSVSSTKLHDITRLISLAEWDTGRILMEVCDMEKDNKETWESVEQTLKSLNHLRESIYAQQRMKYTEECFKTIDHLGLPLLKDKERNQKERLKRLSAQKSARQP